jgi:hypothetical protein
MKRLASPGVLCALAITSFATVHSQTAAQKVSDPSPLPPNQETSGSAYTYCQATANSFGTLASIGYGGSLDLTQATFALTVTGAAAIPNSWGLFTYGTVQTNTPFANGYLCISPFAPGIFKMPTQHLGDGTVILRMSEHPADFGAFTPGSSWNFQFWYRDPPAGGAFFNLSNGLHVDFAY